MLVGMIMNKFYTQTLIPMPKVDCKALWPNDPTDPTDTRPRWKKIPFVAETLWDIEIYNKLKQCYLTPHNVRVFRWAPIKFYPWHIDGNSNTKYLFPFAINWIVEGGGLIQWNTTKELTVGLQSEARLHLGMCVGTPQDAYEDQTFGHGCIVNTTIPHRVLNFEKTHRLSISVIFDPTITYEDTITNLKSVGLI